MIKKTQMNFRSIILASINTSSKMSILYLAFEESTPNFYARKRLSYIEPVLRLVNYRLGERKFKAKFCLRPAETKSVIHPEKISDLTFLEDCTATCSCFISQTLIFIL